MTFKTIWNKAEEFPKENFKYRSMSSFFIVAIIIAHEFENDLSISLIQYAMMTIALLWPFAILSLCVNSKNQIVSTVHATIFDMFWCGMFMAIIDFSFIPSLVFVLVCVADYVAGKGIHKMHRLLLFPLGSLPVVLLQGINLKNETGKIEIVLSVTYGIIAFCLFGNLTYRAISGVRRRNQALEVKQKELAESNAVKDKLISIIAHDIKSPLNSLKGFLFLLDSKSLSVEEQNALQKSLGDHFNHTSELIDNVLQWARSQMNGITMVKELIDIKPMSEKVVGLMQAQAMKKEIVIENRIQYYKAYADPNMVELVFRNLMANAIKFTGQNGTITLSSRVDNDLATFCIEDNGVGISKDSIPRLFRLDKTFTTLGTEKEKGSGLGLSLCKDFIERNGGNLWLESEVGLGSKFYFTLQSKP